MALVAISKSVSAYKSDDHEYVIEQEIKTRHELAQKLKRDVDHYDSLLQLKESEVEAVVQVFRGEIQREGQKSFWKGVAVNFIFFLLGAATSIIVTLITA